MKRVVFLLLLVSSVGWGQEGGTSNSEWMYVGSTWYDSQGNGTLGRLIAVGANSEVHFVWTNGLNNGSIQRFAYYNCWDEASGLTLGPSGVQISGGTRSGYPTLAVHSDGYALPVFHDIWMGTLSLGLAYDFFPCAGAFTPFYMEENERLPLWPKIDIDPFDNLHMVVTMSEPPYEHYYSRAYVDDSQWGYEIVWDIPLTEIATENIERPTIDIACSRHTNRVATAWIETAQERHERSNVLLRISEDGGIIWNDPVNVTNIPPIDTMCVINGGDPVVCNGDTFMPYQDISILLDEDDHVHIAFTAHRALYFNDEPRGSVRSTIWHWTEETDDFSLVGAAWFEHDSSQVIHFLNLGKPMCQKPSLAIDTTTGELFCSYLQFDQHAFNECSYAIGEYFLSRSTDSGAQWALPTNVSNTPGEPNMQSRETPSELDITLAKYVTEGFVHALYMHDYWAGSSVQIECGNFLNQMVYMKTPVDDIPMFPLNPPWEFHVAGTSVTEPQTQLPSTISLHQNFPNPFNSSTDIQFDLDVNGEVSLTVFDVTGREVARLIDREALSAGVHVVRFEGTSLASGVYFAQLEKEGLKLTQKMVLLK